MAHVIGVDLALNHGAMADEWGNIIYCYYDGDGMDSSIESLWYQAGLLAAHTPEQATVVIDWDRTMWSWGRNPKVGFLMTILIIMYACHAILTRRADVHYVAPKIVRKCLNLSPRASKAEVHKAIQAMPAKLGKWKVDGLTKQRLAEVRGDLKDAYILAFTYDCSQGM